MISKEDLYKVSVIDYNVFKNFIENNDKNFSLSSMIYNTGFKSCHMFYCNESTAKEIFNRIPKAISIEPIEEKYFEYIEEKVDEDELPIDLR